jgi:GT2 family glycosyltransferase
LSIVGISIVIPNYNGEHLLPIILPHAIIAVQKTNMPYEIIVSDDCSTDSSISILKTNFPSIKIIESATNKGFSVTANKGIYAAQYQHVLLLNSDVKLTEDYFLPLLRYFDKQDTFGVMGKIIGWNDEVQQDGAKYPYFHGAKIKTTGNYILANPQKNDWLYSMYLSGANAFIDKNKFIEIGGFNELFSPFYVEDYELSIRAWRLGYKCYYEHFSICKHQTSTSIKTASTKKYINTIYYRNKLFLHYIHLNGNSLLQWKLQLPLEIIFSLFTGKFYFFKSVQLFLSTLKKAKVAKQNILALSKKTKVIKSFKEVSNTILQSIATKKIHRF